MHSGESEPQQPAVPDYALDDRLELSPAQLKLVLHDTRLGIIDLLTERAATTSQLADTMDKPKGTVGHHCKALEEAGLIHVVRTAKVRAMEERYYGRTARLFILGNFEEAGVDAGTFLDGTYAELKQAAALPSDDKAIHVSTARYARIPESRAREWEDRLAALTDEFASQERGGTVTYGLLLGYFATDRKGWS